MITRAAKVPVLTFCCAAIASIAVYAQSDQGAPLRFSLTVGSTFTDNRDSVPNGENNTDTYVRPRLDARADWGRGLLDLYYMPSIRYRARPSDVQNYTEMHQDFGVNVSHGINPRLKLDAHERFTRTDDPSIQRDGTTLRRDSSYLMNWTALGAKYNFRPRTSLSLKAEHGLKRYDESDVAIESDENTTTADLIMWHQLARTLGVLATVRGTDLDYYHDSEVDRDYIGTAAGLGLDKIFSKTIRGSVRAGWNQAEYSDSDLESEGSPYFGIDLSVEPMPSRRFVTGAKYQIRESHAYPHASQESSVIHARAELDVASRVTLKFAV